MRRINAHLCEREYPPLVSKVSADRRAYVNEVAFTLYKEAILSAPRADTKEDLFDRSVSIATNRLSALGNVPAAQIPTPSPEERDDISQQYSRLREFFVVALGRKLVVSPEFPGCGFLDRCSGDVIYEDALFEVKAGERGFLSVDIRQLITYAALNRAAGVFTIRQLGLFNPRTGLSWRMSVEELAHEVAGRSGDDLFAETVRIVSSGDTSR